MHGQHLFESAGRWNVSVLLYCCRTHSYILFISICRVAQCVKIIFAVATFISYGLQGYVPVAIIWGTYLSKRFENSNKKLYWEFLTRVSIVLVTCKSRKSLTIYNFIINISKIFPILSVLLAVAIPRLGLFISLFGALCLSVLGLAFPAIMEICVKYPDNFGAFYYVLWKDILLILFGVAGLVIGTTTSVKDIITSFM